MSAKVFRTANKAMRDYSEVGNIKNLRSIVAIEVESIKDKLKNLRICQDIFING